jgi:hypothetical protein
MQEEPRRHPSNKHDQRRAAAWRAAGGITGQQERSRAKNARRGGHSKNEVMLFYHEVLATDPELLSACRDRAVFDDTLRDWKNEHSVQGVTPSNAIQFLRDEGIIVKEKSSNSNSTRIIWTVDIDNVVMSFYDTILRNNPRQRRACTNRRVLNDTINQWKIDQRLQEADVPPINVTPALYVSTLMKLGVVVNTREVSTRDEIIWADPIGEIAPLSEEERSNLVSFDRKQMRANRAGLSFYNQMLKDNRALRKACAFRNIFQDVIRQWRHLPPNAGDPPREGVATAGIVYGLAYKWGLIDHVNNQQGIIAWKEDVKCYNDGVIIWKNQWPEKDAEGNRIWLSDDEFKRRGDQMRNEYAAIVALSFYISKVRDNHQLRHACADRRFLNDTIDAWKMEAFTAGDPPRNASRSNIIFQLQNQWGVIMSFTVDTVVWKQDGLAEVCTNTQRLERQSFM